MAVSLERKEIEQIIKRRPEEVSIPPEVERKEGVTPIPSQFKAQVTDDSGRPLITTPATKTVTIQIPADQTTLVNWKKGKVTDSITWLANFWLRIIKKAAHFGWRLVRRN